MHSLHDQALHLILHWLPTSCSFHRLQHRLSDLHTSLQGHSRLTITNQNKSPNATHLPPNDHALKPRTAFTGYFHHSASITTATATNSHFSVNSTSSSIKHVKKNPLLFLFHHTNCLPNCKTGDTRGDTPNAAHKAPARGS